MIQAVIFDMDGLLIDSEPIWKKAEVAIFTTVGVPLTIEMTNQTMGLRTDEVVEHWHKKYPWDSPSQPEIARQIDAKVIGIIKKDGVAKPGVNQAIAICESLGLPMAIASSSSPKIINAVIVKLGIANKVDVVHSAHNEEFGKPHPGVYISTAKQLGIHPIHCVAFEDSANGLLSAKAAKMKCIAIPEPEMLDDKRFGIADTILYSLEELTAETLKNL